MMVATAPFRIKLIGFATDLGFLKRTSPITIEIVPIPKQARPNSFLPVNAKGMSEEIGALTKAKERSLILIKRSRIWCCLGVRSHSKLTRTEGKGQISLAIRAIAFFIITSFGDVAGELVQY